MLIILPLLGTKRDSGTKTTTKQQQIISFYWEQETLDINGHKMADGSKDPHTKSGQDKVLHVNLMHSFQLF